MPDRPGGVGSRREARERALALLYEAEIKSLDGQGVIDAQPIEVEAYARQLVLGVHGRIEQIDEEIIDRARGWDLDRMPDIDRTVLRMGLYELWFEADVPANVVINEAVELVKRYSTEDSGRFVNGVLAAAARDQES